MNILKHIIAINLILILGLSTVQGKREPEELQFLEKMYNGTEQEKKRIIIKAPTKKILKKIMGENYRKAIFSYWVKDNKTIWILDQIS